MFQSFEAPRGAGGDKGGLERLRALMLKSGLDALLVPRADEHQGEYVPACAERLAWLTGFTGSAGLAIVGKTEAAVFVDGRYAVQAPLQVDAKAFEVSKVKPEEWLGDKLKAGAVVGYDPKLHTQKMVEDFSKVLEAKGIRLKPLASNLVDKAWGKARPAEPRNPVTPQPMKYAGKSAETKIADLQALLKKEEADAVVLTLPESMAWLFNIRGSDVAHNPVPLAFAILPAAGKPELFIDPAKLTGEARAHLAPVARLSPPAELARRLDILKGQDKRVRLDPGTASAWFFRKLRGGKAKVVRASDPCLLPKARKNAVEAKGTRAAHRRDGAAVARFLAWLDREAATGRIDEITAATVLEDKRAETQALKEISFDTISASGPNAALPHYRVTTATNRKLKSGELFLVDSGAQYLDGTTDITRTIAVGKPAREMQERFTLVLKGHIAIATARFPKGTRGIDLDALARRALWAAGFDYDHGTGHGVGSYLSVHEGPQSLSRAGMVALEPGMILSNEPGYYKEGAYGIRIENLLLVGEPQKPAGGEREMMEFETLTLAPIDRRLVLPAMLTPEERAWLNAYHARVAEVLAPELSASERNWLMAATAPL